MINWDQVFDDTCNHAISYFFWVEKCFEKSISQWFDFEFEDFICEGQYSHNLIQKQPSF